MENRIEHKTRMGTGEDAKLINAREASKILGLPDWKILELAKQGKIAGVRINARVILFTREALDNFVKNWQSPETKLHVPDWDRIEFTEGGIKYDNANETPGK